MGGILFLFIAIRGLVFYIRALEVRFHLHSKVTHNYGDMDLYPATGLVDCGVKTWPFDQF